MTSCVCAGEFDTRSGIKQLEVGGAQGVQWPVPFGSTFALTGGFVLLKKEVHFPNKVILTYEVVLSSQKSFLIVELISFFA